MRTYRNRFGRTVRRSDGFEGLSPTWSGSTTIRSPRTPGRTIERYMVYKPCPDCQGKRLKPEVSGRTHRRKNIMDVCAMPVTQSLGVGG